MLKGHRSHQSTCVTSQQNTKARVRDYRVRQADYRFDRCLMDDNDRRFELRDPRDARHNRWLDETTSDAILKVYLLGGTVTESEADAATEIVDRMIEYSLRLACPCKRGAKPHKRALVTAARPGILKRLPKAEIRHVNCAFNREHAVRVSLKTKVEVTRPDSSALGVHGPFVQLRDWQPNAREAALFPDRASGVPRISTLLFRLLESSGLTRFDGTRSSSLSEHLMDGARKCLVADDQEKSIFLDEILLCPEKYDRDFINEFNSLRARVRRDGDWPKNSRPHFYLCGIATGFDLDRKLNRYNLRIVGSKRPRYVRTKPYVFAGEDGTSVRQPYIFIMSYAQVSRKNPKVEGLKCYLHPISQDTYLPVDSQNERETLSAICEWRDHYIRDGLNIVIKKPVFSEVIDEVHCRPDFVIHLTTGTASVEFAVETMGISTMSYVDRKIDVHAAMKKRWNEVVPHHMTPIRKADIAEERVEFLKRLTTAANAVLAISRHE